MKLYTKPTLSIDIILQDSTICSFTLCDVCKMADSGYNPGGDKCAPTFGSGFQLGDLISTGTPYVDGVYYKCVAFFTSDPDEKQCY